MFISKPVGDLVVNMFMCCLFVDIDECSSDPCMNGGTCTDDVNMYSCACVSGYTGGTCEIGMCYTTNTLFTRYALGGYMFSCMTISNTLWSVPIIESKRHSFEFKQPEWGHDSCLSNI